MSQPNLTENNIEVVTKNETKDKDTQDTTKEKQSASISFLFQILLIILIFILIIGIVVTVAILVVRQNNVTPLPYTGITGGFTGLTGSSSYTLNFLHTRNDGEERRSKLQSQLSTGIKNTQNTHHINLLALENQYQLPIVSNSFKGRNDFDDEKEAHPHITATKIKHSSTNRASFYSNHQNHGNQNKHGEDEGNT